MRYVAFEEEEGKVEGVAGTNEEEVEEAAEAEVAVVVASRSSSVITTTGENRKWG